MIPGLLGEKRQLKENREHQDLNPGLLGEKRERYLCAMPPPKLLSSNLAVN